MFCTSRDPTYRLISLTASLPVYANTENNDVIAMRLRLTSEERNVCQRRVAEAVGITYVYIEQFSLNMCGPCLQVPQEINYSSEQKAMAWSCAIQ